MGKTVAEKILARACGRDEVAVGEIVWPTPDLVIVPDTTLPAFVDELLAEGITTLARPDKVVVVCDHDIPPVNATFAARSRRTKELVTLLGIKYYYEPGRAGISHYLPAQEGLAGPGMMIMSMDTYAGNLGAVGAFAPCMVYEMATVLAMDTLWLRVPETIRVNIHGRRPPGVMARDVAQHICTDIGAEQANYRVIEYGGPGIAEFSIDARFVLCNFPVAVGAKTGIVNPDAVTLAYTRERACLPFTNLASAPDAVYADVRDYNISGLEPRISVPPDTTNVHLISEYVGVRIDSAYVGSCASGNLEDLRAAAAVLKGRRVHPDVRLFISPATQRYYIEALQEGLIETFASAGAFVLGPTCQPCYGALWPTADGEVRISTSTRNEPGRMGSFKAEIYLANPATVAASAIKGMIADPREFL